MTVTLTPVALVKLATSSMKASSSAWMNRFQRSSVTLASFSGFQDAVCAQAVAQSARLEPASMPPAASALAPPSSVRRENCDIVVSSGRAASVCGRLVLEHGAALVRRPFTSRSAIDALQLPLRHRDRALGVFAAGAVIVEHVDHQEVGDRGCRFLADLADAGCRQRALARLLEHGVLRIGGPHRDRKSTRLNSS